jgi:hypothetical protein
MHLALLLFAIVAGPETEAATPDVDQERQRQADVARIAPLKARRVVIKSKEAVAELHPEPLLRWSNPSAGSVYGEVFVWSDAGRPVALASIYRWYHPYTQSTFEVVTLTPGEVTAREGDRLLWEAPPGGVAFRPLEKAPEAAGSPAARLRQMRALARRFNAELADLRGGEGVERQLRLLNQPVHRYQSADHGIVDGALFAFVEGTDPEAWLVLEAARTDSETHWQYAVARMNADALRVRLDSAEVARWDKLIEPWKVRRAHYTFDMFRPELLEQDNPNRSPEP